MDNEAGSKSVRVRLQSSAGSSNSSHAVSAAAAAAARRRVAEIVPGLADLSLQPRAGAADAAAAAERLELASIYDFATLHPEDNPNLAAAAGPWAQRFKPRARRVRLSAYQAEAANYGRLATRRNVWYYRDRLAVPRGPCPLHVLKDAWAQGVIDENTLVWGQGLVDWLPMRNVRLLVAQVRTSEVRAAAWFKRTFSLQPALERVREGRREQRDPQQLSKQVERMR